MPGAKSKELQIRFRFKVRERTTFKEQVIERLFPIRILANPGRDCKEIALRPSNRTPSFPWASTWNSTLSTFSQANMPGMISPAAILSAIDDEAFNTRLTDEEKAAFCEGMIEIFKTASRKGWNTVNCSGAVLVNLEFPRD